MFFRSLFFACSLSVVAFAQRGTEFDESPTHRAITNDYRLTDPPVAVRDASGSWSAPVMIYSDGQIAAYAPSSDVKRIVLARPKDNWESARFGMLVYFYYAPCGTHDQFAKDMKVRNPAEFGFIERASFIDVERRTWTDVGEKIINVYGKQAEPTRELRARYDMDDSRNDLLYRTSRGLVGVLERYRAELIGVFGPFPFVR